MSNNLTHLRYHVSSVFQGADREKGHVRGIPCVFRDDFEIVTAVMAGDNHLELRLFSPEGVTAAEELALTARLCKLMDRYQRKWRS